MLIRTTVARYIKHLSYAIRHGKSNRTHWVGGVVGQLFNNEVDLAFGGLWKTHKKTQHVQLSMPWYKMKMFFVVPRPKPLENFWALARPFPWPVWIAVMTILIFKSIIVYGKARVNRRVPPSNSRFSIRDSV